jgi:hypothetical protein
MGNCLTQPFSEAVHISLTFQVDFDNILCNILEKYYPCPGFSLHLGGILQYRNTRKPFALLPGILASYLVHQPVKGQLLDVIYSCYGFMSFTPHTPELFTYFAELLENPERSGTCSFDRQRYTTAAKECLQLYLSSDHSFSMGAMESALCDKALRRHKPSAWIARLGVHSRIRNGRNYVNVQQGKSSKRWFIREQPSSLPKNSPEREYCQSMLYQWALDLLRFLLENSAISLELAKALRCYNFPVLAQRFPRRMRLAKEAIAKYLLRVESAEGNP